MSEKLNLARIKKFGKTFELSINPDAALKFKSGEITDLREVVLADHIFVDARKGQLASTAEMEEVFQTAEFDKVAKVILTQGEIQATAEHRAEERQQRRKQLIQMIHTQAVDPQTKIPHPATRIEAALEEAKFSLVDHKSVEEQFEDAVHKLRPIIPISIQKAKLSVTVPASHTGKLYGYLKNAGKVLSESWENNGDLKCQIELPAGLQQDVIDKLNAETHGTVHIDIVE
ncbi:ribosome assembly factor SBDS [Candidatus Woesearchaeota archaeon]|jgi:ribosome maturation protein SDO1|nr:ribosome assembly factor SBDS [Candidatus Woesearchaeota archaeon]MBT5739984.1 ribosome assembly factor SBDS [Candidatus Woesearchaeota archaeon]